MTPNRRKIHGVLIIVALASAACAPTRPPDAAFSAAERAIADAREAGASAYAPMDLRNAEDRLSRARARLGEGDYGAAAVLAEEAAADGELAALRARLGKTREKIDARTHENAQLREDLGVDDAARSGGRS
jgi:dihydroxyacetone kinase